MITEMTIKELVSELRKCNKIPMGEFRKLPNFDGAKNANDPYADERYIANMKISQINEFIQFGTAYLTEE